MNRRPLLWLMLLGIAWFADPAWGRAQTRQPPGRAPGRAYVTIPFEGNLEDMLRRQFDQGKLDELFKKLQLDLAKMKFDPKVLPLLKKIDQVQKKEIEEFLNKLDKLPPVHQKTIKDIKKALHEMPFPPKEKADLFSLPKPKPAEPAKENLENRMSRWARDLMKNAENSDFADMVRKSSAWQEGLKDFERFLSRPDRSSDLLGLGKLNLPMPKDLNFNLENGWTKLKNLSVPSLPSVKLPNLGIGNPLPGLKLPGLPTGSWAISQAAIWVLVVVGLVLVLWQMFRRVSRPGLAVDGWHLGPWPVDPARISNRAELIAAFDHLALLCIGRQACTWNHRAIGEGLATNTQRRRAALELASLYEWARYAPEPAALADEALASARRDLCYLAGGAGT